MVKGEPKLPEPKGWPGHNWRYGCPQSMFSDLAVSPKDIIDCLDYSYSGIEYLGDALPICNSSFSGPGVAAAFLGAEIQVIHGHNWFHNDCKDIRDLHPEYDPDNVWLNRMKEIIAEAKKRWGDGLLFSMPDLGGTMDVVASLRGSEALMVDLYDNPGEVKRVTDEVGVLWKRFHSELAALCGDIYTDWLTVPSRESSYILQSDFCYMIGTEMFDEFIRPELATRCAELKRPCYHLDGPGQLPHLDSLLSI